MPKTYPPIVHGQLSNPSQLNELYQDVAILTGQVFNVKESTFGAVMNGTSDDGDALRAAITAADVAGGTVYIPHGTLAFTGAVNVPAGVNIWGAGGNTLSPCTTLKALNSAAAIKFGAQEDGGTWGGVSGNFLLDGDNLSANMLYLGRTLERVFFNIGVIDCAAGGYAVTIEEAQNNQFIGLVVNSNRGGGISFDRGCAHNRFFGVEARANGISGGYHVRFTATDATVASLVPYPLGNTFYDSVFEDDGGLLDGIVYHGAGADNAFIRCNFAAGASATRAFPLVLMEVGNAGITTQSTRLGLDNCQLTGTQTQTTGIDLDDASIVLIDGRLFMQGLLNGYLLRDASSQVWMHHRALYSNVTNRLAVASVGVLNTALRVRVGNPVEIQRATTGDTAFYVNVEGDAGVRAQMNAVGTLVWGGGTDAGDTNLYRSLANLLKTDDSFQAAQGLWSSAVTTKTSAYTATFADQTILCDATSGAFTLTLPNTSGLTGKELTIKRTSASNNVTVDGNGADTIEGALTKILGSQWAFVTVRCSAANAWIIVSQGGTVT